MSDYIRMGHNVTNLVYHIVCPTKYRRKIIGEEVDRTLKQIFAQCPEVKEQLWGGEFWTDGYFVATVGRNTSEEAIASYVKNQGCESDYIQLYLNL